MLFSRDHWPDNVDSHSNHGVSMQSDLLVKSSKERSMTSFTGTRPIELMIFVSLQKLAGSTKQDTKTFSDVSSPQILFAFH